MTVHIEGMIVYPENWIIIDFPILWVKYLYNLPHLTDIVTYNHGPETAVNTIPRKKKKDLDFALIELSKQISKMFL